MKTYVKEQKVRIPAVLLYAGRDLVTKRADASGRVRLTRMLRVRHGNAEYGLVEEVVDEEHLRRRVASRAVHVAVERRVRDVEGRLPHVREFWRRCDQADSAMGDGRHVPSIR